MRIGTEHGDKISFERVWVREAVFRDLEDATEAPAPITKLDDLQLSLHISIKLPAGERSAYVTVRCTLEPNEGQPRTFVELAVAVEGHFAVPDASSHGRLEEFAKSQALVLLFPYLRQAITTLTVATRLGGIIIPPINLQHVVAAMRKGESVATPG